MVNPNRTFLKTLRGRYDLTQGDLAEKMGVSRSLVGMWESGRAALDEEAMAKLRREFPLGFDSPSGAEPGPAREAQNVLGLPAFPVSYDPLRIPYAGLVPASSEWGDPLASEEPVEVDAKFVKKNRFACRVVGDSCYPALRQGDLTIWEVDNSPKYGLIVLAQRKGDHGCTVKQLVYDSQARRDRLLPVNPAYDSPPDGEGWGVIARLVGVVREGGVERSWYSPTGIRPKYLTGEPDDE